MSNIYSFSQVQVFNQCPLKYRYQYIDKIKLQQQEETADLALGDIVHKTLEKLYEDVNNFRKVQLDELIDYYHNLWQQKIKHFEEHGSEIKIKTNCELDDFIRRGEKYITTYFETNQPFDNIKVVSTEQNIYFDIDEDIKFRGIIDRLDKVGNDFVINDYKTNKNLPTQQKQEYIEQLTLYGLGIQQKYGKYMDNVRAKLHFLHFEIEDEWLITKELLDEVVQKYKKIIDDIQNKRFYFNMGDKEQFEPVENQGCRFCEYQSICPLFSHSGMDDEELPDFGGKTLKSFVDEYASLSKQENDIKSQKENLKQILANYAENHNLKRLYGEKFYVTFSKIVSYKLLDKEKVKNILEGMGKVEDYLDLDRYKIGNDLKNGNLSLEDFSDSIQRNESYSFRSGERKD
ncbi:RecB family exonuclease [Candidatus Absconditicoccus praedator]|uniref:RecB family exonuclease n=1 Tax=Candidatus Absconditicoccus praedator TaxID=2735562 RepID=UPI001E5E4CCC|nr:PD-(D/E)XK nuclease family protein [Candidatus Absconditicoccus praedator]UFX82810.1 PD-(D/E)XK nuclease family protein [Candidatus Absconditicoccus praedator]